MDDAGFEISAGAATPSPGASEPQSSRLRLLTRALVVVGVLLLVFGTQVDRAVRTAYDTGWTQLDGHGERVPEGHWELLFAASGPAAILALFAAVRLWHGRERKTTLADPAPDLETTPRWLAFSAGVFAVAGGVCRWLAADGQWGGLLTPGTLCTVAAVVVVVGYALLVGNLIYLELGGIIRVTRGVFRRQRVNIAIVSLLTAAMLLIGDTSGQSVDSIRSWSADAPHGAGAARLMLGLAAALMFALALYESGTLLVRSRWASADPGRLHLLGVAAVVTGLGFLVLTPLPLGPGLLVAGALLFLLLLLDLPHVRVDDRVPGPVAPLPPAGPTASEATRRRSAVLIREYRVTHEPVRAEAHMAEWIAITPLLALAAVSVTAAVESALLHGWWDGDTALTLLPAAALAVFAIGMTGVKPHAPHDWRLVSANWLWVTLGVVVLTVVAFGIARAADDDAEWVLAGYGLLWLFVLCAYVVWLFHLGPPASAALALAFPQAAAGAERARVEGRRRRFRAWLARVRVYVRASAVPFVLGPVALGGGIAVFLAVHLEPLRAGQKLGVFTLAFVGLALALPFLHLAVRATLRLRPPKLLWWFGMSQVPVLTLLLLWWIVVGVAQTSIPKFATLHDARLVEREIGAGRHAPPDLARAFRDWVANQDDIVDETGSDEPVPLVLVAAHGGGIRAAYWTAVALDCVVGYSADGVTQEDLNSSDADEQRQLREGACAKTRRSDAQQATVEKRIFLASGVSGGAVGLYAYARQLLGTGTLGTAEPGESDWWVDGRLAADFAAPAIGWALFHDIPNRILGLHPKTGGRCGAKLNGVCLEQDRAAVLEQTFDAEWTPADPPEARIRRVYDLRSSRDGPLRTKARRVPLLAMNSTLTGGKTRAVTSAADLGAWPVADADSPGTGDDTLPLAGTIEIRDALCVSQDLRLSTAALLAARFPYVTPSGRVPDGCAADGEPAPMDADSVCAGPADCDGNYVDGGYTDNSGLATIVGIWPSLRQLVVQHNLYAKRLGLRKIAPVIVELDNHYQRLLRPVVPSGGTTAETLVPPETAFGGRHSVETVARAAAYRILPKTCTLTIAGAPPGPDRAAGLGALGARAPRPARRAHDAAPHRHGGDCRQAVDHAPAAAVGCPRHDARGRDAAYRVPPAGAVPAVARAGQRPRAAREGEGPAVRHPRAGGSGAGRAAQGAERLLNPRR
jgi:hypothetical protein